LTTSFFKNLASVRPISRIAEGMKRGNTQIAQMYAHEGLKMSDRKGSEHLLDRSEMIARAATASSKRIAVAKPYLAAR
jgi:hypothetical protein